MNFGIENYQRYGQHRMANDICYFYMLKNGEPVKYNKWHDQVVVFTLEGIYDKDSPYNRLHFDCLADYFYEMEESEFIETFGSRGSYTAS